MIAVDTTVLIYACDQSEVRRQRLALDLITTTPDCVLLWQVACEFLAASRKLSTQGFTSAQAWDRADGVPRYLAPREPDRRHLSKSPGAAPDPQRVLLGRPHSGRVRRGRRRDPVLRGRARYQRPRLRSRGQSVRVTCRRGCNPQ